MNYSPRDKSCPQRAKHTTFAHRDNHVHVPVTPSPNYSPNSTPTTTISQHPQTHVHPDSLAPPPNISRPWSPLPSSSIPPKPRSSTSKTMGRPHPKTTIFTRASRCRTSLPRV